MTDNRVKSLFETEPLFMKPTQLGLYPRVWNYFGYLPDLGTSYGTFKCEDKEHSGVVTSDFKSPHCPQCGTLMNKATINLEPADYDKIITRKDSFNIIPKCPHCDVEMLSNVDIVNGYSESIHCVNCGADVKKDFQKYVDLFKIKDPVIKKQFTDYVDKIKTNSNNEVKPMKKKTEATYEVLSYDTFNNSTKVSPEKTVMRCYAQETENPYWNIEIEGTPVGRICLKDQANAEVLRDTFVTDYYAKAIATAFSNIGVIPTLKKVNARIWKAKVEESEFHKKIKAEVTERLENEYTEKLNNVKVIASNIKSELMECIALASVAIHKNFYNIGNPLKAELLEEMYRYGIDTNRGSAIIESAFSTAEMEHYSVIIDKAISLLSMSDETRAELAEALVNAGTMAVETAEEDEENEEELAGKGSSLSDELTFPMPDTMANRMATSNVNFTALHGVSQQPIAKSATKESLRKSLSFSYKK